MIDVIKQFEATPDAYPTVTPFNRLGHIDDVQDAPVNADQVWQRIESYVAHRWTPREVVWTFTGNAGDEFTPRLVPMVSHDAHFWGDQWESVTLQSGPFGLQLPFDGTYRITATVGGGDLPAAVGEAFKRLHEYTRGINDSFKNEAAIQDDTTVRNWTGRALQLSGAADVLRPYRRAQ